ncbi:MAG: DUF58 domain-containing protein, partial [Actinomycetota bacterium]
PPPPPPHLPVKATTLVLPRVFPLGPLPFVEPVPTYEPAIHPSPSRGHGPDYLGVREYRPGDPMRHVHWGLTARHAQVMVREFEEEKTRRLAVVVDTERDTPGAWTPLDRCCAVAASLVEAAEAAGHGIRPIAGRSDGIDVLMRADGASIHRWLARLRWTGWLLASVLGDLGPEDLRGVETLVVATPAWADTDIETLAEALADLPVRRVVVVMAGLGDGEGAGAERDGVLDVLSRAGVEALWWAADAELDRALGAEVMPA